MQVIPKGETALENQYLDLDPPPPDWKKETSQIGNHTHKKLRVFLGMATHTILLTQSATPMTALLHLPNHPKSTSQQLQSSEAVRLLQQSRRPPVYKGPS